MESDATLHFLPDTSGAALLDHLRSCSAFSRLITALTEQRSPIIRVTGLNPRGARAFVLAAVGALTRRRCAVVTLDSDLEWLAKEVTSFLRIFAIQPITAETVLTLPPLDVTPYGDVSPHPEILEARAKTLYTLSRGLGLLVLIQTKSLMLRVPLPEEMSVLGQDLTLGAVLDHGEFVGRLQRTGYIRVDEVTAVGEFSWRGCILDVFSPLEPLPVRIELCDDRIASLRRFDPGTQRSVEKIEHARIVPLREYVATAEDFRRWATLAPLRWKESRFAHDVRSRCRLAELGESFPGWEFLCPLVTPIKGTVADYLSDAIWVVEEPSAVRADARALEELLTAQYQEAHDASRLALEPDQFLLSTDELDLLLSRRPRIEFYSYGSPWQDEQQRKASPDACWADEQGPSLPPEVLATPIPESLEPLIEFHATTAPRFHGRVERAIEFVRRGIERGVLPLVLARSKGIAQRLDELFGESGLPVERLATDVEAQCAERVGPFPAGRRWPVVMGMGTLDHGFEIPVARLLVLSETDILADVQAVSHPRSASTAARLTSLLSDLRDLKVGDYVVHIDHGIGQFQGLVILLEPDGRPHEFVHIIYAEGARLYVPVERLDLVQKYVSGDGQPPRLDRLGGAAWARAKARAARSLRQMAQELLSLYARRTLITGHAFSPDTEWQREFEAGFEYELTPDQERAIQEVKADMERPIPMDRLLCGDVGFGKTEVAMRAAFKAVTDGKQVAVLAPTTVLAEQHYRTFTRRFAPFPVNIAVLSRIRPRHERQAVIRGLADGTIDIVIGTHRLLSSDVRFRDLGLLIIDEEQRFGVSHKEKIKLLTHPVDVLTLTATPIPRTLNMALLGLRDLSVIQTPPPDRLAIQTIVAPFSLELIRGAIEREVERGGQVFFIHNRIDSIYTMASMVKRLVPQARIGVTHADLSERELEKTMIRFVQGDLDVLLTTTIIENGIDIPRANTIIINHADRFGLADLYQLRGRVGRSHRRAYAYLLISPEETLSAVARKRLAALKEFSDLGAGFRLAALDLELRGAGNLLGPEQSGHIRALGFELYCQLLERAIQELRGQPIEEEVNTQVSLGLDLRIPTDYIPDMGQRLHVYKRISSIRDEGAMVGLRDELTDRYGPPPPPVENLLRVALLRNEASRIGVLSLTRRGPEVVVTFASGARVSKSSIASLTTRPDRIVLQKDQTARIPWSDLRWVSRAELSGP